MSAMFASWRGRLPGWNGGVGGNGLRKAAARCAPPVLFIGIPFVVVLGLLINLSTGHHTFPPFWDFHTFRDAGKDALNGRSPYPPPDPTVLIHEKSFVYPAPAAVVMVPFALLPFTLSAWLFSLVSIASVPASLRIVGVRDYRCYGVALLSVPFVNSLGLGAISPMLLVGVALVWRYRDRAWIAALALAAVVMLKLFLWPLVAVAGVHATSPGGAAFRIADGGCDHRVLGGARVRRPSDLLSRAEHSHPPRRGQGVLAQSRSGSRSAPRLLLLALCPGSWGACCSY